MQAVLYILAFPALPYILWRSYNRERNVTKGEAFLRYLCYLIVMSCICAVVLAVFGDEDTSFFEKMDKSPAFALKYVGLQLFAALFAAWGEWSYLKNRYAVRVDWDGLAAWKPVKWCKTNLCPVLPYMLAVFVVCLNVSMIFDNVVWGDEAFSVNTAKNTIFGIFQIEYYLDSHPPLYYYWLKLWGDLFGFSIPVCHLASVFPFAMGILLALFHFRKRFGAVPSAFFIVLSGLGRFCLQYNLEIRMYALTFFCLTVTFFCSYRVIAEGKKHSWFNMVFFGLAAAYSHYYGLAAGGILIFFTGAAVWHKRRGRSWIKGLCAILAYVIGYAPWLFILFKSMQSVGSNWWVKEILKLTEALDMVFLGRGMAKFTMPLFIVLAAIVFLTDFGIARFEREDGGAVKICAPEWKAMDDKTYAMAVGLLTVAGTIAFGYFLCLVFAPVLVARYLYPVSAITACVIVVSGSRALEILGELGEKEGLPHLRGIGNGILAVGCAVLLIAGIGNYLSYIPVVKDQKELTQATLDIIGTPDADIKMVTNGVKHLGWTVLQCYYPDNEVVNGDYRMADAARFWYFSPFELSPEQLGELEGGGAAVTVYSEHGIAQYPFYLYFVDFTARS